jgi:hypothetical protein
MEKERERERGEGQGDVAIAQYHFLNQACSYEGAKKTRAGPQKPIIVTPKAAIRQNQTP